MMMQLEYGSDESDHLFGNKIKKQKNNIKHKITDRRKAKMTL